MGLERPYKLCAQIAMLRKFEENISQSNDIIL